jgi:hypothetical protein
MPAIYNTMVTTTTIILFCEKLHSAIQHLLLKAAAATHRIEGRSRVDEAGPRLSWIRKRRRTK